MSTWTSTLSQRDPNTSPHTSQETSPLWESCFWAFSNTTPQSSGISRGHHITESRVSDAPTVVLLPAHFLLLPFLISCSSCQLLLSLQSPISSLLPLSCILFSGFMFLGEGQEQLGPLALHSTNMTYHDPCVCSMCITVTVARLN